MLPCVKIRQTPLDKDILISETSCILFHIGSSGADVSSRSYSPITAWKEWTSICRTHRDAHYLERNCIECVLVERRRASANMVSRGYHWTKHERANVDNSINTFVSTFPSMTSGKRDTSEASDIGNYAVTSPRLLFKYPEYRCRQCVNARNTSLRAPVYFIIIVFSTYLFRLFAQSLEENIVQSARTREVDVIDPGRDRDDHYFGHMTGRTNIRTTSQTPRTKQSWS
jgi:hypothetical protein